MKNSLISTLLFLMSYSLIEAQDQTVGLFLNDSLAYNGYTLFAPSETTYLIDNCGQVVHSWRSVYKPGLSVYLLPNGQLLRTASILGDLMSSGAGGRLELYNWEGDLLWFYDYNSMDFRQHHDIEPLPNGNILILAWEVFSKEEAIAAGRDPEQIDKDLWPDHIVEIEPLPGNEAKIVWEWHAWDHLIQDFDSTKANYGEVATHPELIDLNFIPVRSLNFPGITGDDWLHANGLSYNSQRDEIVLSLRNFSEIIIIDHSTTPEEAAGHSGGRSGKGGDLLYRWGNPQAYRQGDSTDQRFFQQHDPRWIPMGFPNEGQLMVYNNGNQRSGGEYSSIEIIKPPLDAMGAYVLNPNTAYEPLESSRTYDGQPDKPFYSTYMSGAQALPNGNILICVTSKGHFFEVTPDGQIVWDYISPVGPNGPVPQGNFTGLQNVFRATRYPEDYPAFIGKDLSPSGPIELNPLPSDCMLYPQMVSGTKVVDDVGEIPLEIYFYDNRLEIDYRGQEAIELTIVGALGRVVYQNPQMTEALSLDISDWPVGMYFVLAHHRADHRTEVQKWIKSK